MYARCARKISSVKKLDLTAMRGETTELNAPIHRCAKVAADTDTQYKASQGRMRWSRRVCVCVGVWPGGYCYCEHVELIFCSCWHCCYERCFCCWWGNSRWRVGGEEASIMSSAADSDHGQKAGQQVQQEDEDLVMIIASDDEMFSVEDSSDSEEEQEGAGLKGAQPKENEIAEDFKFDDGGAFHTSGGSSWDFTAAISRIEKMERRTPAATRRTPIQAKIEKRHKEKDTKKPATRTVTPRKKKRRRSEDEMEEESESSDDEKEEQDVEEDDVVVEEVKRLQSLLKDSKKDQQSSEELVDALEKKAAEFFGTDPFAAEEFGKTKFKPFADLKLSRPIMQAI
ncbi:hypothetical protein PHYSODRAFT_255833 [Phytophthora sojae]|uniref:Uncharacterized protein n=1 Tax=Phytophthora sojae (strain P6497) TaxID=1094619 RepID=G4ZEC4_PHYSP|nr:hypothetical protein PHYSODRAFT_255833 [Phytophthora sojae]EGZ17887.1 hypothetical protein PHYSODRAFT_255833 [Phytophthora sojae]|eukprot:XP_009526945.1 hypothetical protein PHYSODRAFT_255833 [Phytophthora sojae]